MGEGGAGLGLHYVPGRGSVGGEGGRATASCFGRLICFQAGPA